jgi:hypothetical protein
MTGGCGDGDSVIQSLIAQNIDLLACPVCGGSLGRSKATAFDSFASNEQLFETHSKGSFLDHFMIQAGMLISGGSEGGFFVMIGRKLK